jgi:GPN-loop GTPase
MLFTVGMAGSGKSSLTGAYLDWLRSKDRDVIVVNLDPGATSLPYTPDIDAKKYVDIEQLKLDYGLGPNGALIMASDILANHVEEIREEIKGDNPDTVLVDTPGQIELFAFREGGRFLANELVEEGGAVIYLMDAPFTRSPLNYISNLYLAAAIYSRIQQPQIHVLSKSDMITEDEIEKIIEWTSDPDRLDHELLNSKEQNLTLITRDLANAVFASGLVSEPIPVSSKDNSGLLDLDAAVTRILSGGEENST